MHPVLSQLRSLEDSGVGRLAFASDEQHEVRLSGRQVGPDLLSLGLMTALMLSGSAAANLIEGLREEIWPIVSGSPR